MDLRRCGVVFAAVLSCALVFGAINTGLAQQRRSEIAQSLPSTNLSSEKQIDPSLPAPAPGFARARVADNPQAPEAKPVGEKTCVACHQLEADHFTHTLHALGLHVANRSDPSIPVCETCHGAGSAHAQNPQGKGLIIAYTKNGGTPIDVQTKTCLTCHAGGPRDHWSGSVHQRNGLSCSDCHNPMAKFSVEGSMAKQSINDTCAQCHKDIRLQFNRRSHMPLPEGQMSCDDCHNPHGSLSNGSSLTSFPLAKTNTVNETCYQCHAEKRGPFLFEHAPVRESCLNCHSPHGSNQNTLLVAPIPFLCQQCHTQQRHPNDLHTPNSLMTGKNPDERIMGRGCLTCHANIHGSNAPAGSKFHE
ncbi:MAG: DmsE family decaheme c-type cytochrome [Rudaea sp.]|uniref:DmsE family decaheme c-type cytochrome n=1 Tax=unclassified Rudaea TaxID=2627037 RepID=UPI0010F6B6E9|nr:MULTISPECIES: DmsE family decaheme c-type cytochrome [unclassified Rudaea]MBN8884187.1 DmsE family decaheme c-type cytochrome [Rudaea sp.]MBR0346400.1 DmsE family decaheme c-type cytochrome [Rudaea sp.]